MQSSNSSTQFPSTRWAIGLGLSSLLITASGITYYTYSQQSKPPLTTLAPIAPVKVSALGRLEPQGEVLNLSVPSGQSGAYRIDQLLINEGDWVEAQQIIAVLDSRDRLQSAWQEAQEQVRVAESNLNRVKAGAAAGEIAAQQATIDRLTAQLAGETKTQRATLARLEAEWQNAEVEYQRHLTLYRSGAISESVLDSKSLAAQSAKQQVYEAEAAIDRTTQTIQQQIREGEATLARIIEVRPTDIAVAQAEVDRAVARVNQAQTQLHTAYIRAPKAGRILRIHSYPGEAVSQDGIAELGQTEQMYAIAEIYEGDISKIQAGQTATITADTLSGKLKGTVEDIGWTIAKQDILKTDPTATTDARVIEVKVRLEESSSMRVSRLTNLQVNVEIAL